MMCMDIFQCNNELIVLCMEFSVLGKKLALFLLLCSNGLNYVDSKLLMLEPHTATLVQM